MLSEDVQHDILEIMVEFGAKPTMTMAARVSFTQRLAEFPGDKKEFLEYVRKNALLWFCCAHSLPEWTEGEAWPSNNKGKPMIYLGHKDISADLKFAEQDIRIFVFLDSDEGYTSEVVQVIV